MLSSLTTISLAVVLLGATVPVSADPETSSVDQPQIERENLYRLQIEQKRVEQEHVELRAARRAEEKALALEVRRKTAHEQDRALRSGRRRSGYFLIVIGAVFGGGAIYMAKLGKDSDREILTGMASFPSEIEQTASRGQIYNKVGYASLGAAGLMFLLAAPLIFMNSDPGEYQVVPVVGASGPGLTLSGTF